MAELMYNLKETSHPLYRALVQKLRLQGEALILEDLPVNGLFAKLSPPGEKPHSWVKPVPSQAPRISQLT